MNNIDQDYQNMIDSAKVEGDALASEPFSAKMRRMQQLLEENGEAQDPESMKELEKLISEAETLESQIAEAGQDVAKVGADGAQDVRNSMIQALHNELAAAEAVGNLKVQRNVKGMIADIESAKTLSFMRLGYPKKQKAVKNKDFKEAEKAVYAKLKNSKRYKFQRIDKLEAVLTVVLPEGYKEYARNFLMRFYSHIIRKSLDETALAAAQVISNVYNLTRGDSDYNREFLGSVISVIDEMK